MLNTRTRARVALTSALLVVLSLAASPAHAAARDSSPDACWLNADTGVLQCYDDTAALDAAVLAQTGGRLVREASPVAKPAGALTNYLMAELFVNAGYGGASWVVTSTNSTICTAGAGKTGNLAGIYDNTVSSLKTYIGCQATLYENAGLTGASFGPATTTSLLTGFNDRASSYRVD